MMTKTKSHIYGKILAYSHQKCDFKVILMQYDLTIESNIRAPVLSIPLSSLQIRDKMLNEPHILSLFPNLFDKA